MFSQNKYPIMNAGNNGFMLWIATSCVTKCLCRICVGTCEMLL